MIAGSFSFVVDDVLTFGVLTMHTAVPLGLSWGPSLKVAGVDELEDKLALADVAVVVLHGLALLGETLGDTPDDFFEQIAAARLPLHAGALLKK
jgi:hypothetical protein